MKIQKIQSVKNNIIQFYRNQRLYKNTSAIDRDIYVKRHGSISELENKYGKKIVEEKFRMGYLSSKLGNRWSMTKTGLEDIEIFHCKPSLWESFVSLNLALLEKILKIV